MAWPKTQNDQNDNERLSFVCISLSFWFGGILTIDLFWRRILVHAFHPSNHQSKDWVSILHGFMVQFPVVYAHFECPTLLLHQKHRRIKRNGAYSNEAQLKELLDGILNLILEPLWMLEGVYFYQKCTKFQFNFVLNTIVRLPSMWKVLKKPKNPLCLCNIFLMSLAW